MATRIDIRNTEFNRLFCENVKRIFVKKLRKRNIEIKINVHEDRWLTNLYEGDLGNNKKLNIAMGKMYQYTLILTAQSNGEVYSEVIVQDKDFNAEMTLRGLTDTSGQVKKIGTSSANEDIYVAMDNNFYLEDLNIITHNVEQNTMASKEGMLSWEDCVHANWALNITGQALPSLTLPLSTSGPAAAIATIATTATVPQSTGHAMAAVTTVPPVIAISSPPPLSLPMTPVMFSTPPPPVAIRPTAPLRLPTPSVTTVMAPGRSTQPLILKKIQESLQDRPQSLQTVQYLSNSENFSVPPPRNGSIPSASTPKAKQSRNKKQFKKKKIVPPPNFIMDSSDSSDITVDKHIYESLGEASVESQRQEQYVPVERVEKMVEDAIRKLLQGGQTTTVEQSSSEEAENNERTMVSVPDTIVSVPDIVDLPSLLQLPSVLQPILDAQQNSKEKETNEKGDQSITEGPVTRSQSKSREEENE